MMMNFGLSHTINGISRRQNLALVLYTNLLLLPTLLKIIKKELVLSGEQLMLLLGIYIYIIYIHICMLVGLVYIYTYMLAGRFS